jgi:NAD(P)-dependent dehydrogenase (short-subunit alcohol dehydrogenase family)
MAKARAALSRMQVEIPGGEAGIAPLDLASLASIREIARGFREAYDRLDVLVNSAGVLWAPYSTTKDGFEVHFGTNHLGHFALTGLLLDLLLRSPESRVVTVGSVGHRFSRFEFKSLLCGKGQSYSPARAYGRSKLANLLFTYELQRRLEASGADTISVGAHPGLAITALSRRLDAIRIIRFLRPLEPLVCQSAAMGALPTLRAATDPSVSGGQYYGPGGWLGLRGHPVAVESSKASHDEQSARKLWQLSEKLTGVRYALPDTAPAVLQMDSPPVQRMVSADQRETSSGA